MQWLTHQYLTQNTPEYNALSVKDFSTRPNPRLNFLKRLNILLRHEHCHTDCDVVMNEIQNLDVNWCHLSYLQQNELHFLLLDYWNMKKHHLNLVSYHFFYLQMASGPLSGILHHITTAFNGYF